MGYSLGARISAVLAARHPQRVRSLILGGVGIKLVEVAGLHHDVARALEAPSIAEVTDPMGKAFRLFAEQTKSDLRALAACLRGSRQALEREDLASVQAPTLVAAGTKDDIAGSPHELAALFPNGRGLDITGRDHMVAVGDRIYKAGVLAFLKERRVKKHIQPSTAMLKGAAGNTLVADVFGDAGQPVMLLHGGGQTRHAWGRTARASRARRRARLRDRPARPRRLGMGRGRALRLLGFRR